MKTKKGRLIMFILAVFIIVLLVFSFIAYQQTAILRQRMENIEYFTVTKLNRNEEDFEIEINDIQYIEELYNIITTTKTRRNLFPDHQESIRVDLTWMIRIYYRNERYDEIFVEYHSIFFRWLSTRGSMGDYGHVRSRRADGRLQRFLLNLFENLGFDETPRFHKTQISAERWDSPIRFHESNNDFTFLIGEEVYTFEHAVDVANAILEMEKIDNFNFNRYELMLVEYDEDARIWLFSFWINDMSIRSISLRIAFDGDTGEIIQMWED